MDWWQPELVERFLDLAAYEPEAALAVQGHGVRGVGLSAPVVLPVQISRDHLAPLLLQEHAQVRRRAILALGDPAKTPTSSIAGRVR